MISSMTRFEIVGPRELLWDTLDAIQDAGVCHLEPASLAVEGTAVRLERATLAGADLAHKSTCDELNPQLEQVLAAFPSSIFSEEEEIGATGASLARRSRDEIATLARSRVAQWKRLQARIANLEEDRALLEKYRTILGVLQSVRVHSTSVVIPVVLADDAELKAKVLAELRKLCEGGRHGLEVSERRYAGSCFMALAVPAEIESQAREYIWENKIPEAVFPREYADLPPLKVLDKIERRLEEIPGEQANAEDEVASFLRDFGAEVVALAYLFADTAARFEAYQKAALSKYVFHLQGWVPEGSTIADLKRRLAKVDDDGVQFQVLPTDPHHDAPPTRLENPGPIAPFQTLLGIFPPPTYGSIDPSLVMFFTFPIFFGWMVGDVGYGGLLLLLCIGLSRSVGARIPAVKDVAYALGLAALSSIFFGVLFGEYFGHFGGYVASKMHWIHMHGDDPWHQHLHLWIGRTDEYLPKYLALSVLIGVLHMTLSLGFGIYTAAQHMKHGEEHAAEHLMEKVAMLVGLYGFVLLALGGVVDSLAFLGASLVANPTNLVYAGALMVVVSIGMLIYALPGMQKVTAPIEGVAILSNTISYARLMAVGAAGVVLANMANDIGRQAEGAGYAWGALYILAAVVIHLCVFVVAIFDPLIQALRLHYVEFFSKFYQSNGVIYTPFARKGGSSL